MVNYMRLKELRKKHGLTQKQLASALHVAQNTVCNWENGVRQIDTEYIKQIAEYFHVSTDYLLGREGSPVNAQSASDASSALTPRDNRDIARDMAAIEASLESGEGLMFNGEPLSPEAKESLLAAMRLGLEAAKLKNKERFTPKKYRKD